MPLHYTDYKQFYWSTVDGFVIKWRLERIWKFKSWKFSQLISLLFGAIRLYNIKTHWWKFKSQQTTTFLYYKIQKSLFLLSIVKGNIAYAIPRKTFDCHLQTMGGLDVNAKSFAIDMGTWVRISIPMLNLWPFEFACVQLCVYWIHTDGIPHY